MKSVVLRAQLKEPLPINGVMKFIATGEGWKGWNIYVDSVGRELVVDLPPAMAVKGRIRIPLENVVFYVTGGTLSDKKAEGYSIADVPVDAD